MIVITELAQYLTDLLNETANRPTDLYFKIATQGFHLDSIVDKEDYNRNIIPCFLSQREGEYDPIPDLNKSTISYDLTFYFPVRFKDQFYALGNFLAEQLVGKQVDIGEVSGTCLTTIDPARFGEIETMDLTQFKKWVEDIYQEEINVSENFMTMDITIYLSSMNGYWGNMFTASLYATDSSGNLETFGCMWTNCAYTTDNTPAAQQLLGTDKYAKNIINVTANTYSVKFIIDSDNLELLNRFFYGELNDYTYILEIQYRRIINNRPVTKSFKKDVILLTAQPTIEYGSPVALTFTFGDKL